jgi:hypothetical protein
MYERLHKSYVRIAVDHILALMYFTDTNDVHKKIFERAKKLFDQMGVRGIKASLFTNERAADEAHTLASTNYEGWLQYRIAHLRDDHEAKYIAYLLGEYQRKFENEVARREQMERSVSWRVTKPIRQVKGMLK